MTVVVGADAKGGRYMTVVVGADAEGGRYPFS